MRLKASWEKKYMDKKIKQWLKEGKSSGEICTLILEDSETKADAEKLSAKNIANMILNIKKASEVEAEVKETEEEEARRLKKEEEDLLKEEGVKKLIQKSVDDALKSIKSHPINGVSGVYGFVEHEDWKKEMGESFLLGFKIASGNGTSKDIDNYQLMKEKNIKQVADAKFGGQFDKKSNNFLISATTNAGGFLVHPEFDSEIDKNVTAQSQLMNAIKKRIGTEKDLINSISTFNLSYRANENTAFSQTRPSTAQVELKFKDAGGIVNISRKAMEGSYYNLVDELTQVATDAKIRLLEEMIPTGSVTADEDAFDGIRFQDGITSINGINAGASGAITTTDLSRAFTACDTNARHRGQFIMDTREAMFLAEAKDKNGQLLNLVEMKDGIFYHKSTGKQIIVCDRMHRLLNGVSNRSTGTDVAVLYGDLSRFRYYEQGVMRIDITDQFKWAEDAYSMRFIVSNKWAVPENSLTSFVTVNGIKENAIND
jgi:HK97 family phage major capsid protein